MSPAGPKRSRASSAGTRHSKSPRDSRAAAQGLLAFATLGLGLFVGSMISGKIVAHFATPDASIPHDWRSIWLAPAAMAAVVLVLFALFFRQERDAPAETAVDDSPLPSRAPAT